MLDTPLAEPTARDDQGLAIAWRRSAPRPNELRCSIIIPVFNKAHVTQNCLESLLEEEIAPYTREIIVVDDASSDWTPQLLERYGQRIRSVRRETNEGFSAACNDGARLAEGEFLLFLNNDTIGHRGWFPALMNYAIA